MNPANSLLFTQAGRKIRFTVRTAWILAICALLGTGPLPLNTGLRVQAAPKESLAQTRLTTLDGQQFSLAGLRGKVVVLDFFGMRCVHSRDHVKDTMTSFTASDFNRGLQIIGIESESSTAEQVRQYVRDQNINYPVAQVDEGTFIRFVKSRDLSAPQTLVFGRDGKLLLHTLGYSSKNEEAIRSTIQRALEAK